MEEAFNGNRYKFEIEMDNCVDDKCIFLFRAVCASSGRYSYINNLNYILSEFGIDDATTKYEDSYWLLTKSEADRFTRVTNTLLSDSTSMEYLEWKLDEDRRCGEWENVINKRI